jgi:hypothetical protein
VVGTTRKSAVRSQLGGDRNRKGRRMGRAGMVIAWEPIVAEIAGGALTQGETPAGRRAASLKVKGGTVHPPAEE